MTADELEDLLCDEIADSLDIDWTPRWAAKQIIRAIEEMGRLNAVLAVLNEELATEQQADEAIVRLGRAIDAARNSNQAGENAVVRAARAL